jgi:hypothetical protein
MKRFILPLLGVAATLVLLPTTAVAESATHHYVLVMEQPNFGVAPNGDQIAISGEVDYSVNPKAVEGGGSFTHTTAGGTVVATGTWEATGLLSYQSYGCGVVFGNPIPANLCGGRVAMRVMLTTAFGQLPGILTVICVIGPNPPNSVISSGDRSEGALLSIPSHINFNHTAGGDNVIVQTG